MACEESNLSAGAVGSGGSPDPEPDAPLSAAALRRFHALGPAAGRPRLPAGLLPAGMERYRGADRMKLRTGYPLLLLPGQGARRLDRDLLERVERLAPGPLLQENLDRLVFHVLRALGPGGPAVGARQVLAEAGCAMLDEQALSSLLPEQREALAGRLDELSQDIPAEARLLSYGPGATLQLLDHAAAAVLEPRRAAARADLAALLESLDDFLSVERHKAPPTPERVARSMAGAGALVDPGALAALPGGEPGTVRADRPRLDRIQAAAGAIRAGLRLPEHPPVAVFHDGALADSWLSLGEVHRCESPLEEAAAFFDDRARELADLVRAVRLARLELAGEYDPERHDPWLAGLDRSVFSPEELALLPVVVVVQPGSSLLGPSLSGLARLAASGRPIQVVCAMEPAANPTGGPDPLGSFQLAPAHLLVGFRQAVVHQGTPARPEQMLRGLRAGLSSARTAVHVVADEGSMGCDVPLHPWVFAEAAVETRALPLFLFDPTAGPHMADRVDLGGNPEPEADWPVAGGAPVTFADLAILHPALHPHLAEAPPELPEGELLPLDEWLDLPEGDRRLPCLGATAPGGRRVLLVPTRSLAVATAGRRDSWRALQELAGIHDAYVERAVADALQSAEARARAERERLQAAHLQELARVRREEAAGAIERLAEALVEGRWAPGPVPAGPALEEQPEAAESEEAEPEAAEPEEAEPQEAGGDAGECLYEEPVVDSFLCTSCDDCVGINPLLFVYGDDKQVRIGDPRAGTFAQLVQAAEGCPSHCIHPGRPLDPDEPGLDELVRRAAPFNR